MTYLTQHGIFVLRTRYLFKFKSKLRKVWYSFLGMQIGKRTLLPKISITWPHQVTIGCDCILESLISFKYDGIWQAGPSIIIGNNVFIGTCCEFNITKLITIGDDTLIASGCRFVDHDHGTDLQQLMRYQKGIQKAIQIGNNVWLGCDVIVLKGVNIGDGAIVAAGAVLTKSILPNEIWAGVPAKKIGERKSI